MNKAIIDAVAKIGGELADPVWQWFLQNGPHGSGFRWAPTKQGPPGYSGLDHLRDIVAEKSANDPEFPERSYEIAIAAIGSGNLELIRRGIQILAVVGDRNDVDKIKSFTDHCVDVVANDAKACLYELKRS